MGNRELNGRTKHNVKTSLKGSGLQELLLFLLGRRRKAAVHGRSMLPTLRPGEQVLYAPGRLPQVDDIAVAQIGALRVIKRVTRIVDNRYDLQGDNRAESTDYKQVVAADMVGTVTSTLA